MEAAVPGTTDVGTIVALVLLVAFAIIWSVLPFAILGTKARLKKLIAMQEQTEALLLQVLRRGVAAEDGPREVAKVEQATPRAHNVVRAVVGGGRREPML